MPSSPPGRVVQRGGKAMYERLDQQGEAGLDGSSADPTRSFRNCPSDNVVWPEYSAGWLSRLFFSWFDPLVKLGGHL